MKKCLLIPWRLPARVLLMTFMLFTAAGAVSGQQAGTFRNPLNPYNGDDPWLTYYEGSYYLATTTWTSELTMRKSPTLAGLNTASINLGGDYLRCTGNTLVFQANDGSESFKGDATW